MNIREQGWECPKCGRIWAPKIAACGACNDRQTIPLDQVPRKPFGGPYIGSPNWGGEFEPRFTCEHPRWNFSGDDMSYRHQAGDPA